MLKDLNELTPYERELLRRAEMINRERLHEMEKREERPELRIPAPPPPNYKH